MSSEPTTSNNPSTPASGHRSRRWPGRAYWIFLAAAIVANVVVRLPDVTEPAIIRITTIVSVFLAIAILLVWLAFFSSHSPAVRRTPLVLAILALAAWFGTHRIERVTGSLGITWAWRWEQHRDELLSQPAAPPAVASEAAAPPSGVALNSHVDQRLGEPTRSRTAFHAKGPVPLADTTNGDFPQFLGPHRDSAVEGVQLDRDWQKHPPHKLWSQAIGAGHSGFSVVNGYAVTLEQRGPQELVTCYDAQTGRLKWSHSIAARHATKLGGIGPRSTPTIHEGRVYALGATGILRCLNGADGQLIWSQNILADCHTTVEEDLKNVYWGRSGSPLIVDNLVVVPGGGPSGGPFISLLAYDQETGRLIWQGGDRQISYASPALALLAGVRQILSVNEDNITAHDPLSGATLWTHTWPGNSTASANTSQVVPIGPDAQGAERLLISKGYTGGCSLFSVSHDDKNHWTTASIWKQSKLLKTKFSNVAVLAGFGYALSDGILECVELAPGRRRWKQGHFDYGQILRVGDLLLVESEQGEVALVAASPEEYHEFGRFQALDDQTWNTLCFWGGRYLLVRNSQEAACYELPLAR